MELLIYIVVSAVAAIFFRSTFRKMDTSDRPGISIRRTQSLTFDQSPWDQKPGRRDNIGTPRMLNGSIIRAIFLIVLYIWTGAAVFLIGQSSSLGWILAILLGAPGGYGLAIAWYNLEKVARRRR